MRVKFDIEEENRAIILVASDPLEIAIMENLAAMSLKGTTMQLSPHKEIPNSYRVEMKLHGNGKEK